MEVFQIENDIQRRLLGWIEIPRKTSSDTYTSPHHTKSKCDFNRLVQNEDHLGKAVKDQTARQLARRFGRPKTILGRPNIMFGKWNSLMHCQELWAQWK